MDATRNRTGTRTSQQPSRPGPTPWPDDATRRVWSAARRSRDPRFDGHFFVGVRTTGIYCRPTCPARTALERNVEYFPAAAAAASRGYIACLRCRPEAAAPTGHSSNELSEDALVERALRHIERGALDPQSSGGLGLDAPALAARLDTGERTLRRAFRDRLGATPSQIAMTRRLHVARQLLLGSNLRCEDVAYAVGFGSARRFNAAVRKAFGRSPAELRAKLREQQDTEQRAPTISLTLGYRPPFAWQELLRFLEVRTLPGIERVEGDAYERWFAENGMRGLVRVRNDAQRHRLRAEIELQGAPEQRAVMVDGERASLSGLLPISRKLQELFDLHSDPRVVGEHFEGDDQLGERWRSCPGIRVPGCWDAYELVVRAVLGQQVSVKGARTLATRFVERFGRRELLPDRVLFPDPEQVAAAGASAVAEIGLPRTRAETLHAVSRFFAAGGFDPLASIDENLVALLALPGIGPWTAQYTAMRALRDPDAFPAGDLILRKALGTRDGKAATTRQAERRSADWKPLRAYAVMLLWREPQPRTSRARRSQRTRTVGGER